MAELKNVLAYLLKNYPYPNELSNARVTKMVYLADWKHALDAGHQMTGIRWFFDNYGPFVWDVMEEARGNPDLFQVEATQTAFGNSKNLLALKDKRYDPNRALSEAERQTLQHVIDATKYLSFDEFIRLVYSTYPIVKSDRYEQLDLHALAEEYKETPVFKSVMPAM